MAFTRASRRSFASTMALQCVSPPEPMETVNDGIAAI